MESSTPFQTFDVTMSRVREKFAQVQKLLDKRESIAPENEPYKNKYAAISILQDVESQLTTIIDGNNTMIKEYRDMICVMLASIKSRLGILYTDTEETKAGEEHFNKCMELISGRELEPEVILITLATLNQLGIIWSQWNEPLKAKSLLERAEHIYKDFIDNPRTDGHEPVNIFLYVGIDDGTGDRDPKENLEELHTMTLYYLVQIYELIKDYSKSALYCHKTLYRQLGDADNIKELDYVDWALNVATLSQYFMENKFFSQARYHLAASIYILEKYENILRKRQNDDDDAEMLAADWENYRHRRADVARCWGKYGISLMCTSKQRLLQKVEKDDEIPENDGSNSSSSGTTSSSSNNNSEQSLDEETANRLRVMKFRIPENVIEPIVGQVTSEFLLDFSDAKIVFLNVQKWLEEAKNYYTLENHASDYVQIVQDMSRAFKYLTFFEENEDRQAQMHKKRIDMLENVAKELNPQYYKPVCRQIWIELGETYSDILDIKLERLCAPNEMTAHALTKINRLAKNAIKNFQSFLDSVDHNRTKLADDIVQPTLYSYFHLGRLYNKIVTSDKRMQLVNTQNSADAYRFVVDYCEKEPEAADIMKVELGLCTEFATLLALKVNTLRNCK